MAGQCSRKMIFKKNNKHINDKISNQPDPTVIDPTVYQCSNYLVPPLHWQLIFQLNSCNQIPVYGI